MDIGCFIWTRRSRSFYLFNELPNAPLLLDFVEKDFSILYANMREGIFAFFKFFFCNMVSHRSLLHVPSGISLFREKAVTSVAIGYVGRKQRASLIGKKPHKEKGGREKKKSLGIKIGRLDGSNQLATLISLFALFLLDFPI